MKNHRHEPSSFARWARLRIVAIAAASPLAVAACGPGGGPPPPPAPPSPSPSMTAPSPAATTVPRAPAPPEARAEPVTLPIPIVVHESEPRILALDLPAANGLVLTAIVGGGSSADGAEAGRAAVCTAYWAFAGTAVWGPGRWQDRLDEQSATFSFDAGVDATSLSLTAETDDLEGALATLSAVLRVPVNNRAEFHRVRSLALAQARLNAVEDGLWASRAVSTSSFFRVQLSGHPYDTPEATPKQIEALALEDCQAYHTSQVALDRLTVLVAGPLATHDVEALTLDAFGKLRKEGASPPRFETVERLREKRIIVIDEPRDRAQIFVRWMGRGKRGAYPVHEVLAATLEDRLLRALPDTSPSAWVERRRHAAPVVGVRLESALDSAHSNVLQAIEQLGVFLVQPPTQAEAVRAAQRLAMPLRERASSPEGIAQTWGHWLMSGVDEASRASELSFFHEPDPEALSAAAGQALELPPVVVVIGPADTVAPSLQSLGDVWIVDPRDDFSRTRTLNKTP